MRQGTFTVKKEETFFRRIDDRCGPDQTKSNAITLLLLGRGKWKLVKYSDIYGDDAEVICVRIISIRLCPIARGYLFGIFNNVDTMLFRAIKTHIMTRTDVHVTNKKKSYL